MKIIGIAVLVLALAGCSTAGRCQLNASCHRCLEATELAVRTGYTGPGSKGDAAAYCLNHESQFTETAYLGQCLNGNRYACMVWQQIDAKHRAEQTAGLGLMAFGIYQLNQRPYIPPPAAPFSFNCRAIGPSTICTGQ